MAFLLACSSGVAPLSLWAQVRPSLSWATLSLRVLVPAQMKLRPFLTLPRPATMAASLGGCPSPDLATSYCLATSPCLALVAFSVPAWGLAWESVLAWHRGGGNLWG